MDKDKLAAKLAAQSNRDAVKKKLGVKPLDIRDGVIAKMAKGLGANISKNDSKENLLTGANKAMKAEEEEGRTAGGLARDIKKEKDAVDSAFKKQHDDMDRMIQAQEATVTQLEKRKDTVSLDADAAKALHAGKDPNELITLPNGNKMTRGAVVQENLNRQKQIIDEAKKASDALSVMKQNKAAITTESVANQKAVERAAKNTEADRVRTENIKILEEVAKITGKPLSDYQRDVGAGVMNMSDADIKRDAAARARTSREEKLFEKLTPQEKQEQKSSSSEPSGAKKSGAPASDH
jgi:hypothetical protein